MTKMKIDMTTRRNVYRTLFIVGLFAMTVSHYWAAQETEATTTMSGSLDDKLFEDWPKPKLLLIFTGFMNGYVEPCGCAGLENMKGGLSRRLTFIEQLNEKNWPLLLIDGGNLNKGFGPQEEHKYSFVINEALRFMNYQVVGIGNNELLLPTETLFNYTVKLTDVPRRHTSANVALFAFDPDYTAPYFVVEKNGLKVGALSVISASLLKNITNNEIMTAEAVPKIKELLPAINAEKCDKKVLIVHGTIAERDAILKNFPNVFDFVLYSDTQAEPPFQPKMAEKTMLIDVGEKGKFAIGVGLFDDPQQPVRYQRIPLDKRFANSPKITNAMQFYQDELKRQGLEGLGIRPIPSNRLETNGKYVGSKSCADCHEPAHEVWKKSKHGNAWNSLAVTSKPARQFDPECIACHVVGWNPTESLPYESGFLSEAKTPLLIDVGCESCHGPGEKHTKAEQGNDKNLQQKFRQAVRLPIENGVAKKNCITCHDGDNSPHFNFDTYWPKIVHKETGE